MLIRVVDFESTGIPSETDCQAIVEAGWTDVQFHRDGATIGFPRAMLINPGRPIPPSAMGVHHITNDDVKDAPPAAEAFKLLMDGADMFCAHNVDHEKNYFGGGDKPWICTYKCALRIWPKIEDHKNQTIRYTLDHDRHDDFEPAAAMPPHRAGPDSYVTAFTLRELLGSASIEDLQRWSAGPALLVKVNFGKHSGQLWEDLPVSYLQWIMDNIQDDRDKRATARYWLQKKYAQKKGEEKREKKEHDRQNPTML